MGIRSDVVLAVWEELGLVEDWSSTVNPVHIMWTSRSWSLL